jgi:hypothetical protein
MHLNSRLMWERASLSVVHPLVGPQVLSRMVVSCTTTLLGGNLAAVIAILARDDPLFDHKLTGQLLIIPETYSKSLPTPEK